MYERKTSYYTLIDHTADLGMRVYGNSPEQLFENAALAVADLLVSGAAAPGRLVESVPVSAEGDDPADLMVRWLGEILYLFQGESLIVTKVRVHGLEAGSVQGTAEAVRFDPERHEVLNDIKAVTYHQIEVLQRDGRWEAQVIFDV